MSAGPLVLLLRSRQVAPRTAPAVSDPLPSQSPATGVSPAAPKVKVVVAGPPLTESLISQVLPRTTTGCAATGDSNAGRAAVAVTAAALPANDIVATTTARAARPEIL